jgi:hypothetical protein
VLVLLVAVLRDWQAPPEAAQIISAQEFSAQVIWILCDLLRNIKLQIRRYYSRFRFSFSFSACQAFCGILYVLETRNFSEISAVCYGQ